MLRFAFVTAVAMVLHMADSRAAQTSDPMDRFVTVNGLRLHYLDRGTADKPTLILVHGIEGHAHTFDHIVSEFTATIVSLHSTCADMATRPGVRKAPIWSRTTSKT